MIDLTPQRQYERDMRKFRQVSFQVQGTSEKEIHLAIDAKLDQFALDGYLNEDEPDCWQIVSVNTREEHVSMQADGTAAVTVWVADVICVREAGMVPWA